MSSSLRNAHVSQREGEVLQVQLLNQLLLNLILIFEQQKTAQCTQVSNAASAMQVFDVYLFDELGQLTQRIPIDVSSEDGARERALYLQRTQRASAYRLMPLDIRTSDVNNLAATRDNQR